MQFSVPKLIALLGAVSALLLVSVPAASAADWMPGPGGVLDNTYAGFIDIPSGGSTVPGSGSFTVAGWFVDKTAQGWAGADDVQVWLGTMDGGGKMLAKAVFAQSRPDVASALAYPYFAASGFGAAIAGSAVPAGPQTLNVYAHTPGKGWWFKSLSVNGGGPGTGTAAAPAPAATTSTAGGAPVVVITAPTEGQNVSTKSDFTITGTTSDAPNIDRIEAWIDGERDSSTGRLLGTTTPDSSGSWSITFTPTHFASTHSNVYVYSHDRANGLETEVVRGFNIVDK
ncbi:MAG TPA: Ig-like domain-containing protein [Chloroflexota bacterium]|nr:Ig-like domain-containing protein [Chloroflexota bacterium]